MIVGSEEGVQFCPERTRGRRLFVRSVLGARPVCRDEADVSIPNVPYLITMSPSSHHRLHPYERPLWLHTCHVAPETGRGIVIHTWTAGRRP